MFVLHGQAGNVYGSSTKLGTLLTDIVRARNVLLPPLGVVLFCDFCFAELILSVATAYEDTGNTRDAAVQEVCIVLICIPDPLIDG